MITPARITAAAAVPTIRAIHTLRSASGALLAIVPGDWALDPCEVVRLALAQFPDATPRARRAIERCTIVVSLRPRITVP